MEGRPINFPLARFNHIVATMLHQKDIACPIYRLSP